MGRGRWIALSKDFVRPDFRTKQDHQDARPRNASLLDRTPHVADKTRRLGNRNAPTSSCDDKATG
jgi:hypothetical protein